MNKIKQKQRVMLVRSTGLNQTMIDEITNEIPAADYVIADDNRDAIYNVLEGVNGLIGCPRPLVTPELITLAGNSLSWIHSTGAGCESFFFKELVESPLVLTNGRIIQGPEVAEHAFALLLALTRNLNHYLAGRSDRQLPRPIELRGKTAVVIGGGGGIGMLISERAAAFGMNVIAVEDDYVQMTSFIHEYCMSENYLKALPKGDVVFMAAPVTQLSLGMMNATAFDAMKQGAYFINVSRGRTTVTTDLVAALQSGKLAGAGLDVTDPEPLPLDHPLRSMENVVLTPHTAGLSDHNRQRSFELVKRNIQRFVDGSQLFNVIDKRRAY